MCKRFHCSFSRNESTNSGPKQKDRQALNLLYAEDPKPKEAFFFQKMS